MDYARTRAKCAGHLRTEQSGDGMRPDYLEHEHHRRVTSRGWWPWLIGSIALVCTPTIPLNAQIPAQESVAQQVQQLTSAMARTQAQLEASQHQLEEMRQQLTVLQQRMAMSTTEATP